MFYKPERPSVNPVCLTVGSDLTALTPLNEGKESSNPSLRRRLASFFDPLRQPPSHLPSSEHHSLILFLTSISLTTAALFAFPASSSSSLHRRHIVHSFTVSASVPIGVVFYSSTPL
ncbi:hypothetical protein PIB30_045506 [Stylosanthes scabra]|uniref:Transmembrane protein n=1 Tax=Stylosanthes scabra TaxID=79078 RepID=A0ABU6QFL0_9FABA|nr:hypothetical protein [Stylosanthes scabra]